MHYVRCGHAAVFDGAGSTDVTVAELGQSPSNARFGQSGRTPDRPVSTVHAESKNQE